MAIQIDLQERSRPAGHTIERAIEGCMNDRFLIGLFSHKSRHAERLRFDAGCLPTALQKNTIRVIGV